MVIMPRESMRLFPLRLPPPPPLRRPSAARAVQVGEAAGGRGARARGEGEGERGAALAVTKLGESQLEAATAQSNARMEAVLLLSLAGVVVLLPLTPGRGSADGISNYRMQKRAVK